MADEIHPAFSPVGFEYAKRYKELTEARKVFLRERRTMVIALADVVRASLEQSGLKYQENFDKKKSAGAPRDDLERWTWSIDRNYSQAWNGRQKKVDRKAERSGVEVWLSDMEDDGLQFGVYGLVWFADEGAVLFDEEDFDADGYFARTHRVSADLVKLGIVAPENIWRDHPYFHIVGVRVAATGASKASELSVASLVDSVRGLAVAFVRSDDLLAKYYEERTSALA